MYLRDEGSDQSQGITRVRYHTNDTARLVQNILFLISFNIESVLRMLLHMFSIKHIVLFLNA